MYKKNSIFSFWCVHHYHSCWYWFSLPLSLFGFLFNSFDNLSIHNNSSKCQSTVKRARFHSCTNNVKILRTHTHRSEKNTRHWTFFSLNWHFPASKWGREWEKFFFEGVKMIESDERKKKRYCFLYVCASKVRMVSYVVSIWFNSNHCS